MQQKFKELVEGSNSILVTSHVAPDPDSICSILLLGTTLEANYPDKQITMHSEELPENLKFLQSFEQIQQKPLAEVIDGANLIVMVDAMNFGRCMRGDWQKISEDVKTKKIPVAIIDHHEQVDIGSNQVYINRDFPAAVQEVYQVCFKDLNLQKPEGWAQTTMVGLYSDTAGFTYLKDNFQNTLDLIAELLKTGIKIEDVRNKLNQYSSDDIKATSEMLANIKIEGDYCYSYFGEDFTKQWLRSGKTFASLLMGVKLFTDQFLRNVDGKKWGFAIYENPLIGENYYSVSFRSLGGEPDVAALAGKLNGGGHKGAAGAKIQANNIDEAIAKVKEVISHN